MKMAGRGLYIQWATLQERDPELRAPESFMMESEHTFLEGDTLFSKAFHCRNILENTVWDNRTFNVSACKMC